MQLEMIKTISEAELIQNNAAQNRLMNNKPESKMIHYQRENVKTRKQERLWEFAVGENTNKSRTLC